MRCLAAVVIASLTSASVASAGVELGGTAGLHTFSEDSDLGVVTGPDDMPSPNATSLKNSALFGIRLGVYFGTKLGVEVEGGAIPTEPRSVLFDIWMIAARGQVIYQLRAEKQGNVLIPFALAGAGLLQIVDVGPVENENIVKKDSKITPYLGIGAKYRTGNGWGIRADLRGLAMPKTGGGIAPEIEGLVSIYKEFGRKEPPKKEEPKPLPKDEDPDKDGIIGAKDECPDKAEDIDQFEDENGCPDEDNDKDGVLDLAPDKCPTEIEDKDGFKDEDGCLDADNDEDGVLDAADQCKDKQETRNGFQDEDGCPDEIPETLKKFTGAIQGINFKVNDAALAPGSNAILDKAVAVLAEFKDVKLEIQGHTDDVPLRAGGKFADNTALSQARAETVKAYFVSKNIAAERLVAKGYGDSAPIEDPKTLKGPALNTARTKNRRVEFKLVQAEPTPAQTPPTPPPPAP
jgi:OOP family OmpA-OmpF porin